MAFLPAITAVLFYHSAMDTWTVCSFLMQDRGEIVFLPAVTAVLLHHITVYNWTECTFVCTD